MRSTCILCLSNCNGMRRKCTRQPACLCSHCTRRVCAAVVGSVRSMRASAGRSISYKRAQRNTTEVPKYRFTEKSWNICQLKSKEKRGEGNTHLVLQTKCTFMSYSAPASYSVTKKKKKKSPADVAFPGSLMAKTSLIPQHDHWTVYEKGFWYLLSVLTTLHKLIAANNKWQIWKDFHK